MAGVTSEKTWVRSGVLSSALVRRAVTVLLTVVLVPLFVDRSGRVVSDHQREKEVKVALLREVDEAVTETVIQASFFASRLVPGDVDGQHARYSQTLQTWLTRSSQIGSAILTYYSQAHPRRDWFPLFSAITAYLRIAAAIEQHGIEEDRVTLLAYLRGRPGPSGDLDQLSRPSAEDGYYRAVEEAGRALLAARDDLNADLARQPLRGFLSHWW